MPGLRPPGQAQGQDLQPLGGYDLVPQDEKEFLPVFLPGQIGAFLPGRLKLPGETPVCFNFQTAPGRPVHPFGTLAPGQEQKALHEGPGTEGSGRLPEIIQGRLKKGPEIETGMDMDMAVGQHK